VELGSGRLARASQAGEAARLRRDGLERAVGDSYAATSARSSRTRWAGPSTVPLRRGDDGRNEGFSQEESHGKVRLLRLEPRVDEEQRGRGRGLRCQERLDHLGEAGAFFLRCFREAIAGAVHDVEGLVHAIPVERLRAARSLGNPRHLDAEERVQEARLPDVRPAEDGERGKRLALRAFARVMPGEDEPDGPAEQAAALRTGVRRERTRRPKSLS
jgi:hypothetical protein